MCVKVCKMLSLNLLHFVTTLSNGKVDFLGSLKMLSVKNINMHPTNTETVLWEPRKCNMQTMSGQQMNDYLLHFWMFRCFGQKWTQNTKEYVLSVHLFICLVVSQSKYLYPLKVKLSDSVKPNPHGLWNEIICTGGEGRFEPPLVISLWA